MSSKSQPAIAIPRICGFAIKVRFPSRAQRAPWICGLYHDARMAEVVHCKTSRRFEARYRYPNPEMLQRDEKFQQNRFAAELMEFCLNNGRSTDAPLQGTEPR